MYKKTPILAIETGLPKSSLALLYGEEVVESKTLDENSSSSRELLPAIECVLKAAGWQAENLRLVAVSIGPGSLTGLRVGIATARALASALNCHCTGVSLMAAAKLIGGKSPVLVILPAGKNNFYWQFFPPPGLADETGAIESKINFGGFTQIRSFAAELPPETLIFDDLIGADISGFTEPKIKNIRAASDNDELSNVKSSNDNLQVLPNITNNSTLVPAVLIGRFAVCRTSEKDSPAIVRDIAPIYVSQTQPTGDIHKS